MEPYMLPADVRIQSVSMENVLYVMTRSRWQLL